MIIKCNLKKLLISLLIPLAVGGLSALISGKDMKIYNSINQPPLSPPFIVFPIVWCILYVLMGISLYLVWNKEDKYLNKTKAYLFFAAQLIFNFLWSPIFFSARLYLFAFFILIFMAIATILMIFEYHSISKWAAFLQIPYLIWLLFAGYLNFAIYLLNR
ncbi:MAG: tryptophan-rich sensory protein [Clostridia bacterium]|nr:tryptophan-rich sensory protein [Clostridia bacterium]